MYWMLFWMEDVSATIRPTIFSFKTFNLKQERAFLSKQVDKQKVVSHVCHTLFIKFINKWGQQRIRSRSSSITDAMMYKLMHIMFNVKVFYNMITALDVRGKRLFEVSSSNVMNIDCY